MNKWRELKQISNEWMEIKRGKYRGPFCEELWIINAFFVSITTENEFHNVNCGNTFQ